MTYPPELPSAPRTIVEFLRWRAEHQTDRHAITFLADAGDKEDHWTYSRLDRAARAIGACLQREGLSRARALILEAPGPRFLAALAGCLYAGTVAIPAYPPRANRSLGRLEAMLRNADVAVAIGSIATQSEVTRRLAEAHGGRPLRWLVVDEISLDLAGDWV